MINEFRSDKTMPKISAQRKPSTLKPGTMLLVRRIRSALMTKVKSPSVTILIGSVRRSSTGLIIALMIPKTTAVTKAARKLLTCTPGSKYAETMITTALKTQLIKMFILSLDTKQNRMSSTC